MKRSLYYKTIFLILVSFVADNGTGCTLNNKCPSSPVLHAPPYDIWTRSCVLMSPKEQEQRSGR